MNGTVGGEVLRRRASVSRRAQLRTHRNGDVPEVSQVKHGRKRNDASLAGPDRFG
eukprot:CAMPEP_0197118654 /NCGR_PEP_ID=MMETSP1390-20130617/1726_1 /TAXON_ID=38833 /ORGANISM="Micromonas sp., Strain CCMP2099" /LENGTH=54 /DNA_ID=CAMNT_0042560271 /DNA_START=87 /DNA_END=247 /DNA_ORIENTATION=-